MPTFLLPENVILLFQQIGVCGEIGMKIRIENERLIFNNSAECIKKIILLIVCVVLLVSVIIEGTVSKLEILCVSAFFGFALAESFFNSNFVSSFVIDESGITEIKMFIFWRHIEWPQIEEYYAENYSPYRSSSPTHRRFVFVYGMKHKTVNTPHFPIGDTEQENKIFLFCDKYYEKII